MILDNKTKKYFKIICLVLFVVALTGCTANLDSSGKLIADVLLNNIALGCYLNYYFN